MEIKTTITNANLENVSEFKPLTIRESCCISDSGIWASSRRAIARNREIGADIRKERLKLAMIDDIVKQIKAVDKVVVYDRDNEGKRYSINLLDGRIEDTIPGVIRGIPQRKLDNLALVIDLISFEDYLSAKNADESQNDAYFAEWKTMANLTTMATNTDAGLLILVCPRTGDMLTKVFERDDANAKSRLDHVSNVINSVGDSIGVRSSLGPNPVSVTCRTCIHCMPGQKSNWYCLNNNEFSKAKELSERYQSKKHGCHLINPNFIPLKLLNLKSDSITEYQGVNDEVVTITSVDESLKGNHSNSGYVISSHEAAQLSPNKDFFNDQNIEKIKDGFAATVG